MPKFKAQDMKKIVKVTCKSLARSSRKMFYYSMEKWTTAGSFGHKFNVRWRWPFKLNFYSNLSPWKQSIRGLLTFLNICFRQVFAKTRPGIDSCCTSRSFDVFCCDCVINVRSKRLTNVIVQIRVFNLAGITCQSVEY